MPPIDPVTSQIVKHKLYQVIEEAIIALENVSGSPITNEGHDMMVSLYKADGGLMLGGVGFLHHLTSAAQAVKHVIASFSENPGIYEGDVYFFNDAYTAALHPPDVYIISPIHYKGKLTGFVANFVHVTDIGAIDPGGFAPNARESYHEGFQTKGLKIVERGVIRKDAIETFLNMVRDPDMTYLDLKSQMAANHVAKERMLKLYDQYGVDAVDAVSEGLIQQSENLLRQRLRELPDGTWRARQYVDIQGAECKVELTATKSGDTLTYDFTDTSPQVALGINCCYWATWGAMFAPLFPLLAWNITWNEGLTRPVKMIAPKASVVNCQRPAPVSIATVGIVEIVNNLSTIVLSKMLGASEKYKNRATAIWHGSHAGMQVHSVNRAGEFTISSLTDTFAGSGGARAFADGVELGGEIPNVVSRWANVESQELNTPMLYLYRRLVPDSGGAGKYRGGVGHEYAFTPHGVGTGTLGAVLRGKGTEAPMALGLFGGHPGNNVVYNTYRKANIDTMPHGPEATESASVEHPNWGVVKLAESDIQYVCFMGGGGYGDPLDREPERVATDVARGLVRRESAADLYGVVLASDGQPDLAATLDRRQTMRMERLGRTPACHTRQTVPATGMRINEYLQRTAAGETQCVYCSSVVAPAGADWKEHAAIRRAPVSNSGPLRTTSERFRLVEAFCPHCATLLDTDLVRDSDPPLHDRVAAWPKQD